MDIMLIRHGKTAGNAQKRYVGRTDEPLSAEGKKELVRAPHFADVQAVYVSPMRRCMETADMLFPDIEKIVENDFRECDFGLFEYKNYMELNEDACYQKWIDSGGTLPFPGGESRSAFQKRCAGAFCAAVLDAQKKGLEQIACVVHGGTIMSILDEYARQEGSYYDFQVKNGDGYVVRPSCVINTEHMIDFGVSICYSIKQGKRLPYKCTAKEV